LKVGEVVRNLKTRDVSRDNLETRGEDRSYSTCVSQFEKPKKSLNVGRKKGNMRTRKVKFKTI